MFHCTHWSGYLNICNYFFRWKTLSLSLLRPSIPHQLQQVGPWEEVPRQSWPKPVAPATKFNPWPYSQPCRQPSNNWPCNFHDTSWFSNWFFWFSLSLSDFEFYIPTCTWIDCELVTFCIPLPYNTIPCLATNDLLHWTYYVAAIYLYILNPRPTFDQCILDHLDLLNQLNTSQPAVDFINCLAPYPNRSCPMPTL